MATKYDFWEIYIRIQVFLFVQISLSCPVGTGIPGLSIQRSSVYEVYYVYFFFYLD